MMPLEIILKLTLFSPTPQERLIKLIITLLSTTWKLGIGFPLLSWISSYLVDRRKYVKLFNISLSKFKVSSGVPQGGHLSPLIFNIFVNSIFSNVLSVRLLLFADDGKLFSRISSSADCDVLQSTFNDFIYWCQAIGLTLNFDKCKIISFSKFQWITYIPIVRALTAVLRRNHRARKKYWFIIKCPPPPDTHIIILLYHLLLYS